MKDRLGVYSDVTSGYSFLLVVGNPKICPKCNADDENV